jgi:hydroxypyruvate reductase
VAALILSDVVGNPLDVIASGPTVPDPTTFEQALSIVERARSSGSIAQPIIEHLKKGTRGEIPETVKPNDAIAQRLHNVIIGSNSTSCLAAISKARDLRLDAKLVTTELIGEAQLAGVFLAEQARDCLDHPRPFLRVYGGETTVTVKGSGVGGRNLETALGAVEGFQGLEGITLVTLATDGEDGPSGAAGAVVTCETIEKARSLGIDAMDHLRRNDSYSFFQKVGGLIITGSTGTNVNDINFIFGF